jgi:hypothetical protein
VRELKTVSEVIESFSREEILPPFSIKLESISLGYECGYLWKTAPCIPTQYLRNFKSL